MSQHTPDMVLVESRSMREMSLDQIAALGKVKALTLLPDDTHATIDMVASYYEVGRTTLESLIEDNRDELTSNGMRTLQGRELREFIATLSRSVANEIISPKTRSLLLFNRRAVLNVGMLLRDSDIARQVRHYLLSVEELSDEDLRRAAEARLKEKVDYRQFRDLIAGTATDYLPSGSATSIAFGQMQNALYRSVVGMTAKELVDSGRALQTWVGKKPTKQDREIAKNYLTDAELERLNKRVKLLVARANVATESGELTLDQWTGLVESELGLGQLTA